jgi:hypothetical protein
MSEIKVNKISPATSTDITLGDSGDTFTVPSGATIVNSGTATGFGGGGLLKTDFSTFTTQVTHNTSWASVSNTVSFTPTSATSDILIFFNTQIYMSSDGFCARLTIDGSEFGANRWYTTNPIAYYGASSTYHSAMFQDKYDNTNTTAKDFLVEGRAYSSAATSQYNSRPSTLLIMEIGV